jgi:uncharacterized protein YoxC
MDAYQILVVVLSVMLALLLVITTVFVVLLIKILKRIKRITDKADHVIDSVETAGDVIKKAAGPLALGRLFKHYAESVKQRKCNRKEER